MRWLAAALIVMIPLVGTAEAQESNSASLRIGYLDNRETGENNGNGSFTADLYTNLTVRFGLGLELGINRFSREELTDKYYQVVFMLRNRETWGLVRPYVSGGGGLYLFHGGYYEREDPPGFALLQPNSPPVMRLDPGQNGYAPSLGWTFGVGAELDVLPGPLFLEGDLRGHLVLASFNNPRWFVASIGLGIDWMGKPPG